MKRLLIYLISFALVIGCSSSHKELYEITDDFVKSLETTYQSYGFLGGSKYIKKTSDGLYQVMPTGRLINVKILKEVGDEEYEDLRADIEDHYKGDTRVNKVYISGGGTVMIDCRN